MRRKKYFLYDCQKIANGNNGVCLSNIFKNTHSIIKWQCMHGHIFELRFDHAKNGHWCPICGIEKQKQTCLKKYGVLNVGQSKMIQQKMKQTNIKRYGIEYPLQNVKIKEKMKQTNIKRYGVEYPLQNVKIKEKMKQTYFKKNGVEYAFQNKNIQEKSKQTNLERYGVKYPSQNVKIKEKMKQSCLIKYGVEYPLQNELVKKKMKQTMVQHLGVEHALQNKEVSKKMKQSCLIKFGVEYPAQNKEVKEKQKQTNLIKYGVENPSQSSGVYQKCQKSGTRIKKYIAPSGKIFHCQGYEPFALQILLKELKYDENDIVTLCKGQKMIPYYFLDAKHYYNPDIIILSEHKIIEVKSDYTFEAFYYKNMPKALACIDQGWKYEFWVFIKGELIIFNVHCIAKF